MFHKKGTPGHQKRTELAAALARRVAGWLPDRACWLVGDGAYVNAATLKNRPANLGVIGPLRPDAALYGPPPERRPGQRGAPRKRGDRLPTPKAAFEDTTAYPPEESEIELPDGPKRVRSQVMAGVQWYTGAGSERVSVVLVRDLSGRWRDTALVVTAPAASAAFAVAKYCRRWSIKVAFRDAKQYLGLHDPHVRLASSVERAHAMAWFAQSLTVLWYACGGRDAASVRRNRPWYGGKPELIFPTETGLGVTQLGV